MPGRGAHAELRQAQNGSVSLNAASAKSNGVQPRQGLRILLHDYCGHPFQFELAIELARRGHTVEHLYCASNPTTPQGVDPAAPQLDRFQSRPIGLRKPIPKGAFVERFVLERQYGAALAGAIVESRAEMVVLANTPIDSLGPAMEAARRAGATTVVWVQDLLGEAALRVLPGKIGSVGKLIGHAYRRREARLLAGADYLIAITEDFASAFDRAGIPGDRWTVIPNWAPLGRIQPCGKVNAWSLEQGVHDKIVLLYSGNLGFKHNPRLLLAVAEALKERRDAVVILNSQGEAADWLRAESVQRGLTAQLRVNGFQPFERISEVLGSADVLLAVLEPDAGVFSVPSKVLSNLCAGRPQVLAVPAENLAAKIVTETSSGLVCDPRDEEAFVAAALAMIDDAHLRRQMGENARAYAERNFRIDSIAERFEAAFDKACGSIRSSW